MILGRAVPSLIQDEGLQLADLSPQRFGKP
jgi:hypothetical protein